MKKNRDDQALLNLYRKFYKTEGEVQFRMQQLSMNTDDDQEDEIGYIQVLTDPRFRKAAYIGAISMMFAQLTGINSIIFYSSQIFA